MQDLQLVSFSLLLFVPNAIAGKFGIETLFKYYYFFHNSSGGDIRQSLRSDWVWERAAFSHLTNLRFELSRFEKHVLFAWKPFKLTLPLREKKKNVSVESLSLIWITCVFIVIYSLKNCSVYGITALNQSGLLAKHFVKDGKKNENVIHQP